jgi:hypothetical protein
MFLKDLLLFFLLVQSLVLTFSEKNASGQIVSQDRIFPDAWQNAGSTIDTSLQQLVINVRDFGATGNGKINDYPAVDSAISSLKEVGGVIFFPEGTYLIKSPLNIPSGVVLRGEFPKRSLLIFDFVGDAIKIFGKNVNTWTPLILPSDIHSDRISVSNPNLFSVGGYAVIRQANDPSWNIKDRWAEYSAGQIINITDIKGNILFLERPLRHNYSLKRNPEIGPFIPNERSGVENLKIERRISGTNRERDNKHTIHFYCASNGWVKGVHSYKAFGSHVAITNSTKVEVAGCFFDDACEYDTGGSGGGVRVQSRSGECLIENNIFRRLRHSILLQSGANGNVFGYNYSCETRSSSHPSFAGDISLHGNYPYANLFEGNIVEHIWIDRSHRGRNGPFNTFFRNRAEKCGFNMSDRKADNQNIIGNELFGGNILSKMAVGNGYRLAGKGHFTYGNNTIAGGLQPAKTKDLTDYSYYLNSNPEEIPEKPKWWTIPDAFPVIGPPHPLKPIKNNPARARYIAKKPIPCLNNPTGSKK